MTMRKIRRKQINKHSKLIEIDTEPENNAQIRTQITVENKKVPTGVLDVSAAASCGPPSKNLISTSSTSSKNYELPNSDIIEATGTAELKH
jgi:hypothetical protein